MITMKMVMDGRKDPDGTSSMDLAAFYDFDANVGKIAKTYRRGDAIVMARGDGEPVSISIANAHEIDATFAQICHNHTNKVPVTNEQMTYAQNYCLRLTIDILKSANASHLESELRPENMKLQLEFA